MRKGRFASEILLVLVGGFLFFWVSQKIEGYTLRERVALLQPGDYVDLGKLQSRLKSRTFVIVASSDSEYSQQNLAFHQALIHQLNTEGIAFVVLVPDDKSRALYEKQLGVVIDVQPKIIRHLGIEGYPSIVEIDGNKTARRVWEGYVRPSSQRLILTHIITGDHVISSVPAGAIRKVTPWTNPSGELSQKIENDSPTNVWDAFWKVHLVVRQVDPADVDDAPWSQVTEKGLHDLQTVVPTIDIRSREMYAGYGDPRALNIPFDELSVRANTELKSYRHAIIDCSRTEVSACDLAAKILAMYTQTSVLILDRGSLERTCKHDPIYLS